MRRCSGGGIARSCAQNTYARAMPAKSKPSSVTGSVNGNTGCGVRLAIAQAAISSEQQA